MSAGGLNGAGRWLAGEWAARLSEVLESMTGEQSPVAVDPGASAPAPEEALLWWRQDLGAAPGAAAWLGAAGPAWTSLGDAALKAAGIGDASAEDIRATFLEAASQAFSAAARTIGERLRREVECGALREEPAPPRAAGYFLLRAAAGEGGSAPLWLAFNGELLAALLPPPEEPVAPPPAETGPPAPKRTMELLLDVELPVSVSFGRAQLPLKDVLKLTTGSIVELNRPVSEPVEIIVNNCVIARGEVVVLEGNYGVRIQQIVSRQERLRTLY